MNILISHVFSEENKGDAALLSILVSDIRSVFGDAAHTTILTSDNVPALHTFEGVRVKRSFIYYALKYNNPVLKFVRSFFVMYATLIWARLYKLTGMSIPLPKHLRSLSRLYADADMIVAVGGGYLRGTYGFGSDVLLMLLLHPFKLASILGKPTVMYPQSIGPFGSRFQERQIRLVLKNVRIIMVREHVSYQVLERLGITHNVIPSIDSGFLFDSTYKADIRTGFHIPTDRSIVGITVRNWLTKIGQATYEKEMALFIDRLIEKYNAHVLLIPQVTAQYHHDDDRVVSRRVYASVHNRDRVLMLEDSYSHHAIKALYSELDYMIGTRFHSVIFALTSHVPSIAIEYEHKAGGIMRDLGLDQWVLNIKDVQAKHLLNMFDRLVAEQRHYKKHLETVLRAYIKRAQPAPAYLCTTHDDYTNNML